MLADVLPDPGRPLDRVFTYIVPQSLESSVSEGIQVLVPFGKQTVPGFIIRLHHEPPREAGPLKEILDIPEGALSIHHKAIHLARWISEHYLCSLGQALRLALPPEATLKIKRTVRLGDEDAVAKARAERPSAAPILDALAGREISVTGLRRRLRRADIAGTLNWLRARGAVVSRSLIVPPHGGRRQQLVLEPAAPGVDLRSEAERRKKRAPRQAAVLTAMARRKAGMPLALLCKKLKVGQATVRPLIAEGILRARAADIPKQRSPGKRAPAQPPSTLTLHQGTALREIVARLDREDSPVFLLFGVPGSGKTEVVLRAVHHVISGGQQAIVLLPEISLTARALAAFEHRFPGRLALLHSGLSAGERHDEWRRVQSGDAAVVVGARSAVFAPCPRPGLIVVDDEHDPSYKQENVPLYHARDVAIQRARMESAGVILSSATPSLESFRAAEEGKYRLLHLATRVDARPLPQMTCADLRGSGARPFTPKLVMAMKRALDAGGRVILFLNRRGFSTALLCPACGRAARCPSCEVCLTYHLPSRRLICHHCGLEEPAPDVCSNCGNPHMVYRGFGTQRLEQEIRRVCPAATVGRLDSDATANEAACLRIVSDFRRARTRVLIGTQMVTKGLEFPDVSLVGVIAADAALTLPDFRAAERTFQLLTQAAARSGGRRRPGKVVLQTYQPEHYAIQAALRHDFAAFYQRELAIREEHGFPPFSVLAAVIAGSAEEDKAKSYAHTFARRLADHGPGLRMLGPAPAPISRLKGRFRWQILLRAADYEALLPPLREALRSARPPRSVAVTVDVDPISLL